MSKIDPLRNVNLCANNGSNGCRITCEECREIERDRNRSRRREEIRDEAWDDLGKTLRDMGNDPEHEGY